MNTSQTTPAQSAPDPLIGRVVNDRYRILKLLAKGGMGRVYRAEQSALGRPVALKVLSATYHDGNDPEFHRRFFLEAATSSKLRHPNTVTVFDYGKTDDEVYYIAMELLEGRTLHQALVEGGSLSVAHAVRVATEIARSLREAHGKGVIHRDLKPANVFLVRHDDHDEESVKVLDFGLVKNVEHGSEEITKAGACMGSPRYMAPEQIRNEALDARVDVYALGVVMFQMLTGRVPFDGTSSINTMMAHVTDPVPAMRTINPDLEIPPALEVLVRKCLEKSPGRRYQSMNDLLRALAHNAGASLSVAPSGEYRVSDRPLEYGVRDGNDGVDTLDGVRAGTTSPADPIRSPTLTSSTVFAQTRKSGVGILPLALIAAAALSGVGGFLALSRPMDSRADGTQIRAAEAIDSSGGPAAPAKEARPYQRAPAVKKVVVALRSTPAGAYVTVGKKKYGPTPVHVLWTGTEAAEGRQVTFIFQHRGYRDLALTQEIHGDRMDVEAPPLEPRRGTDHPTYLLPVQDTSQTTRVAAQDTGATARSPDVADL